MSPMVNCVVRLVNVFIHKPEFFLLKHFNDLRIDLLRPLRHLALIVLLLLDLLKEDLPHAYV